MSEVGEKRGRKAKEQSLLKNHADGQNSDSDGVFSSDDDSDASEVETSGCAYKTYKRARL